MKELSEFRLGTRAMGLLAASCYGNTEPAFWFLKNVENRLEMTNAFVNYSSSRTFTVPMKIESKLFNTGSIVIVYLWAALEILSRVTN